MRHVIPMAIATWHSLGHFTRGVAHESTDGPGCRDSSTPVTNRRLMTPVNEQEHDNCSTTALTEGQQRRQRHW